LNSLEAILEEARRMPFQEIADSPTVKYYTNWRVFAERLDSPESSEYPEPPKWLYDLGDSIVILHSTVESNYPNTATLRRGFPVYEDVRAKGKLELYNTARLTAGVEVRVPDGADVGRVVVASIGGNGFTGHHVRVLVGEGAEAEIVFADLSGGLGGVKILTAHLTISAGAKARLLTLADHRGGAVYTRRSIALLEKALLDSRTAFSAGDSSRLQDDYRLEGTQASLESRVSGVSTPGTWGDVVINALHEAGKSRSLVGGRGVALPGGTLAMRGLAMVLAGAEWSASKVDVHVASLGDGARAYASPMLEIHTGAVEEAYHSASVSSYSEEALFYLGTRGLDPEEAKTLLVDGILAYSGVLEELGLPPSTLTGQ